MQKMDIASFLKCVSELPSLIPLSVTAKLVVLLPRVFDEKLADFPFRIVCSEEDYGVKCLVYQSSMLCETRIIGNIDSTEVTIRDLLNIQVCGGVSESELKTDVTLDKVIVNFINHSFVYRSRGCLGKMKENESLCSSCLSLVKKRLKQIKQAVNVENLKTHRCPCDNCHETFPRQRNLSQHIKTYHKDMFKCSWDMCEKHFGSQNDLDVHMKRHLKEFSHFCDECDKGFVSGRELRMHQQFHKPTKEYVCKVCSKSFPRQLNLTNHLTLHTGAKNYVCVECGRYFTRLAHLKEHKRRTHSEGGTSKSHTCDQCHKSFHAKQQLNRHMRVHSGARPYSCNLCDKTFSRSHHLSKHCEKIHKSGTAKKTASTAELMDYDIPSPSQTFVIQTSDLQDQNQQQLATNVNQPTTTLFYHQAIPEDIIQINIPDHVTLFKIGQ